VLQRVQEQGSSQEGLFKEDTEGLPVCKPQGERWAEATARMDADAAQLMADNLKIRSAMSPEVRGMDEVLQKFLLLFRRLAYKIQGSNAGTLSREDLRKFISEGLEVGNHFHIKMALLERVGKEDGPGVVKAWELSQAKARVGRELTADQSKKVEDLLKAYKRTKPAKVPSKPAKIQRLGYRQGGQQGQPRGDPAAGRGRGGGAPAAGGGLGRCWDCGLFTHRRGSDECQSKGLLRFAPAGGAPVGRGSG